MLKKIRLIIPLIIIFLLTTRLVVNAADKSLSDQIYAKLAPYGLTQGDRVKMERYIVDNNITNEQATTVLAKIDEATAIMKDCNTTNIKELSSENIKKIKSIAQEAASVVGLSLIFKTNSIDIYKDGKLVEAIDHSSNKLAYTGNSINPVAISCIVAMLALAITIITKEELKNRE